MCAAATKGVGGNEPDPEGEESSFMDPLRIETVSLLQLLRANCTVYCTPRIMPGQPYLRACVCALSSSQVAEATVQATLDPAIRGRPI